MNTKLRTTAKNDSEKDFLKLMNNSVFGKTMENVRKHIDNKLVATGKRRNQLVSEPNYHTAKWFSEVLLTLEMKKIKVKINKPVYLGLSILEIRKRLMYEFWYDDIANDVEQGFDTSSYEVNRPLPTRKNKRVIGLMKDELGGIISQILIKYIYM